MTDTSPAAIWAAMLKHYRETAGLSQTQLADRVNFSAAQVASVETGRRNPSDVFAQRCDDAIGAKGALMYLFQKLFGSKAFHPGFQEWPELEQRATMIRGYESTLVPGLLQTPYYGRIILRLDGEEAVAARLARQIVLSRENPPVVRFVIDEWVLRRPVGDAKVMNDQLEHIVSEVTGGRVNLQVLRSGVLPDMYGAFALATVDGQTVGYVESTAHVTVLTDRDKLHMLESFYDRLLAEALNSTDSLELISQVKEELWKS